ncbi:MAG TPA: glycosyltransferase family 39 protein [Acidobacteriaceae bacterium]
MSADRGRSQLGAMFSAGAALVAGLLLRLWFLRHYSLVTGDSLLYGEIAKNWLLHGIYGFTDTNAAGATTIRPTLIRLPGYPLFLAACFRIFGMEHYRAVLRVQAVVDLLTCALAGLTVRWLFGVRAALAVLWLAALCPFTANYAAAPLTETLTLNAMALVFYAFLRWQQAGCGLGRWFWIMGAALAWSILLRPEQGLLTAAVLPAVWVAARRAHWLNLNFRRTMLSVVLAALCAVLPLAPWTARNWSTFHVFQPLAPRDAVNPGELDPIGFNRWFRSWGMEYESTEEVYWNYGGFPVLLSDLPTRAFDADSPAATAALQAQTASLLAGYNKTMAVTPQIDARFGVLAAQRIRAHPVLYHAGLPFARVVDMLLRPRTELLPTPLDWWRWRVYRGQTLFAGGYAALDLAYLVLGIAGFLAWKRRRWSPVNRSNYAPLALAMLATILLRLALLLTLDNSEPRYTLELFPVLFVFAGALFARRPSPDAR